MTVAKWLERYGKVLISSVFVRLQGSGTGPVEELDLSRVQRVLFVRVNFRLGNLLLATPGFAAARVTLTHSEIDVLTTSAYPRLLDNNPDVDHVFVYDRRMLLRPWTLVGLIRQIRDRHYDLVVDSSDGESFSGALFTSLSRGRWLAGLSSSRYKGCFNVTGAPEPGHVHRVDILLTLLESIGIRAQSRDMKVTLSSDERRWAERRWRKWGLSADKITVGVNVGARGEKRWPMDDFLSVIRWLDEELGAQVVMFVGPQEIDRLTEVRDGLPPTAIVDTTSDVRRFAALLARCAIVVTSDTGPMHLAAAVGVPTVSIFLRHDFEVFAPQGEHHRVVHPENGIGADAVIDALSDLRSGFRTASDRARQRSFP